MPATPQTTLPIAQVRELPAGDRVTGFYLLTKCETRQKRDGAPYLVLALRDSSGSMDAKKWEDFDEFLANAAIGDIVKVEGIVDRYRDIPGLVVSRIRIATSAEAPDRRMFLAHSSLSAATAQAQTTEHIESIENSWLKSLLEAIFGDEEFQGKFLEAPGGKLWHHAALGGLAEHTLSIIEIADAMSAHYPELNRDLLVTGAFLHDIGKVFELSTEVVIDYTSDGRLLGHIVQGTLFIEQKIAAIEGFPAELRKQLLHLILSHQGDGSMGSPVKPLTLEAIVLHYCDELDSKINAFRQIRAVTPVGQEFSDYVKLMERFFYFKSATEERPSDE
jgi:3'-5' exoribonuclease